MKVSAAYLRAQWQTELRTVELPEQPLAGEVLLRVAACGVCGSDLTWAQEFQQWQAFGHEVAGVIEKVGPGVDHLSPGQTVVLESSSFCGHCELCRNGRVDLCNKAPAMWGRVAMGFADHMIVPACCVVPYEGLSADVASLAEPAGVACDMVKTAGIQLGDSVAIVGPGPIALMALPLALRSGAAKLVCIGHSHSVRRLQLAGELGATTLAIDGPLDQEKSLHRQFNHVLMTAPVRFVPQAMSLLAYGGILTYIGAGVGSGNISFDGNDFHLRKLQLRSSFASPALYFPLVLKLLQAGIIPGEKIISHRFQLPQIAEALTISRDHKDQVLKVIVRP